MTTTLLKSRPYEVRFDKGRHHRAKLGFVVLAMEQTVEDDVFRLAPEGVGVHISRMAMSNEATIETLKSMEPEIGSAASLLLPDDALNVVSYTCNCGTMVIGETAVIKALRRGRPEAIATTVMTGVTNALRAVGACRIVVATPYLDEINVHVLSFLESKGFEVLEIQGLNLRTNKEIDCVEPAFLREFGASLDRYDADALFICCGALRTLDIVGDLEAQIGKPVIVSNQAMMWDCLRSAEINDPIEGYGRLLRMGRGKVDLVA